MGDHAIPRGWWSTKIPDGWPIPISTFRLEHDSIMIPPPRPFATNSRIINPFSKGPFTLKSLPGNAERTERLGNPWLKKWMFLWLYNLLYMICIIIHRKDDIFTSPCDATVPFWRGFWWKKPPKTRKNAWKKRDIGGIPLQNCMFSVCFCSYLSTLSSPIFFRPFLASGRPL